MRFIDEIRALPIMHKIGLACLSVWSCAIFAYSLSGGFSWSPDQKSLYRTSHLLVQKQNPYALSNAYIKAAAPNISFAGLDAAGGSSLYPPSAHLLFIPFYAFLVSSRAGTTSWLIWNVIFLAAICYVISKRYLAAQPFMQTFLLVVLSIGAYATKSCLRYGQTSLFCFAFFLLALFLKDKNRWLAGIALACAVTKPNLMVLFVVYLLLSRNYTVVLVAALVHAALTWGLAAWLGISVGTLVGDYCEKVALLTSQKTALWLYHQVNGVSLRSILYILGFPRSYVLACTVVLYAGAAALLFIKRKADEKYILGLAALLTIFIDYHWHYDFVVLFVLLPVFAKNMPARRPPDWSLLYYLFVLYMPDFLRAGGYGVFLRSHMHYLLAWQISYTLLFVILLLLFWFKTQHRHRGAVAC